MLCLAAAPVIRAQFVISEFMANNLSSADVDEDTQHEDWIEIQNTSTTQAFLNGWYLTDDAKELRKWQFPVTLPVVGVAPGARLVVWASSKNRRAVATRLHTNFKLSSQGEFLALVRPDGVTVEHGYSPAYPAQFPNGTYGRAPVSNTVVLLPEVSPGKAKSPLSEDDFTTNFTGWNNALTFDDSTWQAGTSGFGFGTAFAESIGEGGDVSAMMRGITPLCLLRYRFDYTPQFPVTALRLRAKYDDGFTSWLNGSNLATSGAPGTLTWNAAALSDRADFLAASATAFTSATGPTLLRPGSNLLAIAMMNKAATELTGTPPADNTNVLMRPQLEIDVTVGSETGYLATATRGAANSALKTAIGPAISDTTDRPPQPVGGADSAPLRITTRVGTTLKPLAAVDPVVLRWRRMYTSEATIPMVDDGTNGDDTARDNIYTALVPTTTLLPGEIIRWRIVAKDNGATPAYAYDPPYPGFSATTPPGNLPAVSTTIEAEQYYGTMSLPVFDRTSTIPVLHWFFTGGDNTTNDTGTRCSFFWQPLPLDHPPAGYQPPKPRFYDNVLVNIHGQSSTGFPKKSHDLSFSKDNRFLWKDGTPATSGVNLLGNFADKSKVRNPTVWWVWEKTGHIASHYDTLVRVQQNKVFKGLYDIVENGNGAWLQRQGLDEAGALYKIYNQLDSTAGTEKKNPDDTNVTDLNALITGLDPAKTLTNRLRYLYDNVNVPALINCLATHSLVLNRDFGHKNFYMYRDTHGTLEWSMLPWDQDLCLGHTWTGSQNYFDDDIHSQAALQIGVPNRLIELVYSTPELNQMFVRRLRTLADQFYVSATETNGPIAQHIRSLLDQIDATPDNVATGKDDADLEARAWGFWTDGNGGAQIPYTDSKMSWNTARQQAARILSTNAIPPNSGGPAYDDGTTSVLPFLPGRRDFFFKAVPPTSPGLSGALATQTFPASQPAVHPVIIEQINAAPLTGTYQGQEYFVIRNPNNYAVDLSGWKLGGSISMLFQGGTVIPAAGSRTTQTANAGYTDQMIVANQPAGFRARTVVPGGNQYRLVTGPYQHQLNARGGRITLSRPLDPLDPAAGYVEVQAVDYTGTPTPCQNFLRITELNFRPAPATPDELNALPGLVAGDFEYIELFNAGPNTLELGGAFFEEGVEFVFPASYPLASGGRCVVVASQSAFQLRYGTTVRIAGEFMGALDNGGETLRLLDPYGEEVLDFTYNDDWYPVPAGQYRSFNVREPLPLYSDYGNRLSWQLSGPTGGTPGTADPERSVVYEGWRYGFFSKAEWPTAEAPDLPAAPYADPDQDGWRNIEEYAFGSVPTSPNSRVLVDAGRITVGGEDYLTITFTRFIKPLDLIYTVECSSGDAPFTWSPEAEQTGPGRPLRDGMERVTYRDTKPISSNHKRFMRIIARK